MEESMYSINSLKADGVGHMVEILRVRDMRYGNYCITRHEARDRGLAPYLSYRQELPG